MTTKHQPIIVRDTEILAAAQVIRIGDKTYRVKPPTIKQLSDASEYLRGLTAGERL